MAAFQQSTTASDVIYQLTSKECLSVVAPGQTNTLHRGRCGETVDIQLINQCFTLQILSEEREVCGRRRGRKRMEGGLQTDKHVTLLYLVPIF